MRKIGLAILLTFAGACSPASDVPTATAAADRFHQQFNAGDYASIYDGADRLLKNSGPAKGFVELLQGARNKLGDFRSAEVPGWTDQSNSNGHFVTLIYHSKFARAEVEENFVFRIDGNRAVLISYHVSSEVRTPS